MRKKVSIREERTGKGGERERDKEREREKEKKQNTLSDDNLNLLLG